MAGSIWSLCKPAMVNTGGPCQENKLSVFSFSVESLQLTFLSLCLGKCYSHLDFSDELEVLNVDFDFVSRGKLLRGLGGVLELDPLEPFRVPFRVC